MYREILFIILSWTIVYAKIEVGFTDEIEDISVTHLNSISDQVLAIVDHYKQPDPVGLPGAPIPDPLFIPETSDNAAVSLKNVKIYGLSKFKIEELNTNLANMQLSGALSFANLFVQAGYTVKLFPMRTSGKMNLTLDGVYGECKADLHVTTNGDLEAKEIKIIDLQVANISIDTESSKGLFSGSVFSGIVKTLGPTAFSLVKPFIVTHLEGTAQKSNDFFRTLQKQTLPNSIAPIDLAIAEGRKYVRQSGYDPYKIPDYKHSVGVFAINISNILVSGLSSFYRTGNLTLSMRNNTLQLGVHVSTKRLQGKCEWELSFGGFLSRYGSSSFSIEYLTVETKLNQSLDVRNRPKLEELEVSLGNIQLRMDGIGTIDYLLEFLVNILPNILRFQIVEVMEDKLKQHLQEILDSTDVEKAIENLLPQLDNLSLSNRTISTHLDPPEKSPDIDIYEEISL